MLSLLFMSYLELSCLISVAHFVLTISSLPSNWLCTHQCTWLRCYSLMIGVLQKTVVVRAYTELHYTGMWWETFQGWVMITSTIMTSILLQQVHHWQLTQSLQAFSATTPMCQIASKRNKQWSRVGLFGLSTRLLVKVRRVSQLAMRIAFRIANKIANLSWIESKTE